MRTIISFLFMALPLGAQQQSTVWQVVATNANAALTEPLRNIGQSSHIMTVIFKDAPGLACTSMSGAASPWLMPLVAFRGKYTSADTTGFQITTRTINITSTNVATDRFRIMAMANGAFPQLHALVQLWDTVNCRIDVAYTGALTPITLSPTDRNKPFANLSATQAGATGVLITAPTGFRIAIYSIVLNNVAAQDVLLYEIRSDKTAFNIVKAESMCVGCIIPIVAPDTNTPLYMSYVGSTINLDLSGPTKLNYAIMYRFE